MMGDLTKRIDDFLLRNYETLLDKVDAIAAERDNLMQILGAVRVALRTPDDVDVCEHARQVAAKAAKWDALPWDELSRAMAVCDEHSDEFGSEVIVTLLAWYDANEPQEGE